jgi:glyceraldehyde 3-phosphate dehydrogenase
LAVMAIRVGINGFGRIGRLVLRSALERGADEVEVVAVNDLTDPKTNAHLFRYDSTYGPFKGEVHFDEDEILIGSMKIRNFASPDPAAIDWGAAGVEVVVESTGRFTSREDAQKHLRDGVKKVIISAPAKGEDVTLVLGVNNDAYDPRNHHIISNASCTTNCLAPMAKVLLDAFGIERGLMTTIHSYTNDQRLQDQFHKDLRRARAAAQNLVPTSTGAAKAIGLVLPALQGKMHGYAVRTPTSTVSLVDLTVLLEKDASAEAINEAFRSAASGALKGILRYTDEPLVSTDFIGDPHSCTFDSELTTMIGERFAKVVGWYDNEWGYACRVVDLIPFVMRS